MRRATFAERVMKRVYDVATSRADMAWTWSNGTGHELDFRSPVNSQHKGQWRGALMFSLICAWLNGWRNNCKDDLKRYRAHYDVTVMRSWCAAVPVATNWTMPSPIPRAIHFGVQVQMDISRLVLQLSLPYPLKPGVKSRMKMYLEQRRQAMLQIHLSDEQFYCVQRSVLF